jgi:hypothetical protein
MSFSIGFQDDILNWFRGRVFPVPPKQLWLGMHSTQQAMAGSEVSSVLGGRILVLPKDLSEPADDPDGLRVIVNRQAILSQPATQQVDVVSAGLWAEAVGGRLLLSAVATPALTVRKGDPAVFYAGFLQLRATA